MVLANSYACVSLMIPFSTTTSKTHARAKTTARARAFEIPGKRRRRRITTVVPAIPTPMQKYRYIGTPQTSASAYCVGADGACRGRNPFHEPRLIECEFQANRYWKR